MSPKHTGCHAFRAIKKPVLAWEREARFNLKIMQANVETRRGNKETLQSMCKAPSPPTSPPNQATAFANIAQHWLDKHRKNKKITEHTLKLSRNVKNIFRNGPKTLQILPKATKQAQNLTNVSKATPKATKVRQKSSKEGPEAPQMVKKDTKKLPKSTPKGIPKRGLNRTPNWRPPFSPNVSKTQRLPCCQSLQKNRS